MNYLEESILWREFRDGMSDVEDIISKIKRDYAESHDFEWNPKLDEWELCVRKWWCSPRYEKDREAYKKIYERLILYYDYSIDDQYFDSFDFSVEFYCWKEEDIKVRIDYDLIGDDYGNTQLLCIEGTRATIIAEIDKALHDDPAFPESLKYRQ